MKWLEIVRFELVHQLRRRSTWLFFALFLFPLIGVTNDVLMDAREREVLFNAPLLLAQTGVLMSLIALPILAAVAGDAATRDVATRLEPLMHAAPVGRAAYVGGRFLGAFAVVALLLAAVPLAHALVPLFHSGIEAAAIGPFRPAAHLQSYFLLILPNAFVATALSFALAMRLRHTLGSYAVVALLFAWTQLDMDLVGERLGRWDLARLLDFSGIAAVSVMSQTWAPLESSERLIGTDGALLWNRLLWIALALAVLVQTARRFDFGASAGAVRWWRRGRLRGAAGASLESAVMRSAAVAVPHAPRNFGAAGRVRQTLAIARDSLREMAFLRWLVLPALALKVALNLDALAVMGAGTPILPTTDRVLEPFDDLPPPIVLLIVLFPFLLAGELVWRERDANLQALSDAAPVPDGLRFVGKLLGLWLVVVALHALLVLAGVITQIRLGWYDFEPAIYLQVLFGLELVDHLVLGLFALSVHVLVNHKHVGHVLALFLVAPLVPELLGIEHPLLLLFSEPSWRHSPISGFGPFLGPVLWFDLYWAAWVLLLALVARLFWVRGVERGIRERVRIARRRFAGRMVGAVGAALALVLLAGGFVLYNTNVLNPYRSTGEHVERLVEYERRYGGHARAPQPRLCATELEIELYPERRAADVRGVHHLINRTPQPIDSLHVAVSSAVETEIELDRAARAAVLDDDLGHRTYALEEPLQPGDSLRLSFVLRYAPRGFPAHGIDTAVVGNGSFIVMADWVPLVGYQPDRELADAILRSEHGLPERVALPSLDDLDARSDPTGQERIDLEVVVGTAADQLAVAPGALQRSWTRDGRRYFHYATSAPIGNGYAIFSAAYAVRTGRCGDVALEVVHHPAHDLNVALMLRGMQASLEQYTRRFGPYPHDVLRMVEYPAAGGSLHATSGTIWFKELFSLFDPRRDARRIELPFAVVAHEVAHQWWGGQLGYARVEGAPLLSESLAWYSALGVVEQEYGTEHLQRFLAFMREAYLRPRSRADVPLLRAADWFQAYRKGPFAMVALREYVGQENVDLALRRLLARHASHEPPFPVSLDLYRELQAVTPDSLQGLLADLFERNTFWELRARHATVRQAAGSGWHVDVEVEARKVAVDSAGAETDLALDDLIEIGVFAPAQAGQQRGEPLHLALHRVRTGTQTITLTLTSRPAQAGIDPRHLLIDAEPDDNLVDVSEPPANG